MAVHDITSQCLKVILSLPLFLPPSYSFICLPVHSLVLSSLVCGLADFPHGTKVPNIFFSAALPSSLFVSLIFNFFFLSLSPLITKVSPPTERVRQVSKSHRPGPRQPRGLVQGLSGTTSCLSFLNNVRGSSSTLPTTAYALKFLCTSLATLFSGPTSSSQEGFFAFTMSNPDYTSKPAWLSDPTLTSMG